MRSRLLLGGLAVAAAAAVAPQPASALHQYIACTPAFATVCDVVFWVEHRLCSDPFACTTG